MKWGEIEIATLQKMFANNEPISITNIPTLKTDSQYSVYFNSMPTAANEALLRIATNYKHIIKRYPLLTDISTPDTNIRYNLKTLIPDFYKFKKLIYEEDGNYSILGDYHFEDDDVLIINSKYKGNVTIEYYAYPAKITDSTPENDELDVPDDVAVLLPLYIASELYKEDDIQIATIYRNQFEVGLQELRDNDTGDIIQFQNTKGWY